MRKSRQASLGPEERGTCDHVGPVVGGGVYAGLWFCGSSQWYEPARYLLSSKASSRGLGSVIPHRGSPRRGGPGAVGCYGGVTVGRSCSSSDRRRPEAGRRFVDGAERMVSGVTSKPQPWRRAR